MEIKCRSIGQSFEEMDQAWAPSQYSLLCISQLLPNNGRHLLYSPMPAFPGSISFNYYSFVSISRLVHILRSITEITALAPVRSILVISPSSQVSLLLPVWTAALPAPAHSAGTISPPAALLPVPDSSVTSGYRYWCTRVQGSSWSCGKAGRLPPTPRWLTLFHKHREHVA